MSDISAMLRDKLKDQGAAQRTATLATLAGTDGVRTLTALYDAGPKKLDAFARGLERTGTALDVAKKKQDNVAGAWEQFTGTIESTEAALFSKFQQPLKEALLDATKEVNTKGKEVEEFFDRVFEMPEFKSGGRRRQAAHPSGGVRQDRACPTRCATSSPRGSRTAWMPRCRS